MTKCLLLNIHYSFKNLFIMLSKIRIDFDESNQKVILIEYIPSDDVRDKMVKSFLEGFNGGSCYAGFHYIVDTTQNSRAIIKPYATDDYLSIIFAMASAINPESSSEESLIKDIQKAATDLANGRLKVPHGTSSITAQSHTQNINITT